MAEKDKLYVYSTLATDQDYAVSGSEEFIRINGDAGITGKNLVTSKGAVTTITPEQYIALQDNHVFKLHADNGFIVVDEKPYDKDDVLNTLNPNDPSKPFTTESYNAEAEKHQAQTGTENKTTVSTGKPEKK
jgi:hypothetical protein